MPNFINSSQLCEFNYFKVAFNAKKQMSFLFPTHFYLVLQIYTKQFVTNSNKYPHIVENALESLNLSY